MFVNGQFQAARHECNTWQCCVYC